MKNSNKKYFIAALIGVGSLGVHMSTMAQSNTYENQRNTAGYSESDSNTYRKVEHRGDETRNYNMENTHEVSTHQRKMNDLEYARKNGLLTFDETYPQNYFDYQKRQMSGNRYNNR